MRVFSESMSFEGWNIIEFVKGRKKMIIALISGALAYAISSDVLISAIAVPLTDMILGITEYYIKEYME